MTPFEKKILSGPTASQSPREYGQWWIVSVHADDESALELRFDSEDGGIHVIEYSAFEALQRENLELKRRLKEVDNG